jgi:hypothetical protein
MLSTWRSRRPTSGNDFRATQTEVWKDPHERLWGIGLASDRSRRSTGTGPGAPSVIACRGPPTTGPPLDRTSVLSVGPVWTGHHQGFQSQPGLGNGKDPAARSATASIPPDGSEQLEDQHCGVVDRVGEPCCLTDSLAALILQLGIDGHQLNEDGVGSANPRGAGRGRR